MLDYLFSIAYKNIRAAGFSNMPAFIFIALTIYRNSSNEYCGTSVGSDGVKMKIVWLHSAAVYSDQESIGIDCVLWDFRDVSATIIDIP